MIGVVVVSIVNVMSFTMISLLSTHEGHLATVFIPSNLYMEFDSLRDINWYLNYEVYYYSIA